MASASRKQPEPDSVLLRRVAGRDEAALAALYDRYAGVVYSVANRILRDSGEAEEVLQDIFYQLWRTASSFDSARGSLPGWLLVTARNRSIDRLRRRNVGAEVDLPETFVAGAFNLESAVSRSELVSKVKAALDGLPQPQRQVMDLAYFEGLTHSEIAKRTGDPLGTVKTRLRTALQTLKRVLNL